MSDLITITRWRSLTDPHGQRIEASWDWLQNQLEKATIIGLAPSKKKERKGKLDPDKDSLRGWSAATFMGDQRKKAACESVTAECIDYDGGVTIEKAVALWGKYRGFLHTSPSHQFEDYGDRFRVVLQISRPVTPDEHERIFSWITSKCDAAGHAIDEAPKDPSRLWFLPGRLEGAPFETRELTGEVLDVDKVLAEVPTTKAKRTSTPRAAKQATDTPANDAPPSRHITLVKAAARMRGRGAQPEHVAAVLSQMNERFEEPKPAAEVDKIAGWAGNLPDGTEGWFRYSDQDNAEEIIRDHGAVLHDCHERGWMHYVDGRWTHDTKKPVDLARLTMRRRAADAVHEGHDGKLITKLLKRDTATSALGFVGPRLAVRITAFDSDPWLFNCKNGTLNLRTGELKAHDSKDLITKMSSVSYDSSAKCPTWLAHLEKVIPDTEVRSYLQRLAGYALTGVIREHVLPIHWGDGGNGKGVTFNTLLRIWGDYGTSVPVELLMQRDGHDEHPTERAQLLGARLVVASETAKGRRLNEALIKQLTGGDPIKARFMRQDYFQFLPTHKLNLLTNYQPGVRGTDTGIWRRVKLTPWTVILPDTEQKTDFEETLLAELPGILNWAVEGCTAWQRTGLAPPRAVADATQKFREQSDVLGRFVEERCVLLKDASVTTSALYSAYKAWCGENGEKPTSQKALGADLTRRWNEVHGKHGRSGNYYIGIGLRQEDREGCEPCEASPRIVGTRAQEAANLENDSHPSHPSQEIVCETCGGRIDGYGVCVECGNGADPGVLGDG